MSLHHMRFVFKLSNVTFSAALLCAVSSCVLGIIITIQMICCFPAHYELGICGTSLVSCWHRRFRLFVQHAF